MSIFFGSRFWQRIKWPMMHCFLPVTDPHCWSKVLRSGGWCENAVLQFPAKNHSLTTSGMRSTWSNMQAAACHVFSILNAWGPGPGSPGPGSLAGPISSGHIGWCRWHKNHSVRDFSCGLTYYVSSWLHQHCNAQQDRIIITYWHWWFGILNACD